MRITIISSLLLLCTVAMAQTKKPEVTDNLFQSKFELLAKHFPAQGMGFSYATYQLPVSEFLSRLDKYKNAGYQMAKAAASPELRSLNRAAVDAYALMLLRDYQSSYGVDSARQEHFFVILRQDEHGPAQEKKVQEADKARYIKKMSVADSLKLEAMINQKLDMNNAALFLGSLPYRRAIDNVINYQLYEKHQDSLMAGAQEEILKFNIVKKLVSNQFIKDYYAYYVMDDAFNRENDSTLLKKVYQAILPEIKEPYYRDYVQTAFKNVVTYVPGKPAPSFSFQDVSGKTVTLADLKGKYVYIDVWATWCGPCKAEIPYLAKIEEQLHGRKIHFVSISVDKMTSYDAWKSYVLDNKLKGIQLIADNNIESAFIKSFGISYIPRFLLIDPEGNIKDSNAKRPSDPALLKELSDIL